MEVGTGPAHFAPGSARQVRIISRREIGELISTREALDAVRKGFAQLGRGEATLPPVMLFDVPENSGEVHVKGAYLKGARFYSVKFSSVFDENPRRFGLPPNGGLVIAFDAATGAPSAVLFDDGFLTDIRTGAAGALAIDLLAKQEIAQVGIIGAGIQARFQLDALLDVRRPSSIRVYDIHRDKASDYAAEMGARHDMPIAPVQSAREAIEGSDIVVCVTTTNDPYLRAEWLSAGVHVNAIGADNGRKHELEVEAVARADKVVVDSLDQCVAQGELSHAIRQGVISADRVYGELGALAAGIKAGRTDDEEITVADLTGVGVQDTAVANLVAEKALAEDVGMMIERS